MSGPDVSESGMRLLSLAEALCGFAAEGATNTDLAKAAKTSAPNVTKGMAVLIHKGWARKDETTGRFFPTPHFSRMCFRVNDSFDRVQRHHEDLRRNMTGSH